jgi:hypothetical protein
LKRVRNGAQSTHTRNEVEGKKAEDKADNLLVIDEDISEENGESKYTYTEKSVNRKLPQEQEKRFSVETSLIRAFKAWGVLEKLSLRWVTVEFSRFLEAV